LTAGRWSWKLISAKKCVIAYLPNELARTMDDAKAKNVSHAVIACFVSDDE
jgi:hypothetical protein